MPKAYLFVALPLISATTVSLTSDNLTAQAAANDAATTAAEKSSGLGVGAKLTQAVEATDGKSKRPEKIVKSEKEWRKQLSRKQFEIARQGGTEQAFTNRYWRHKAKGMYQCVCCELDLFPSTTKYKSGTGWPSFYAPAKKEHIATRIDKKLFYSRTEVLCSRCDAHLGHVFSDGPPPTGLRFCLNSAALTFESEAARKERLEKEAQEQAAQETGTEKEKTDLSDQEQTKAVADPER